MRSRGALVLAVLAVAAGCAASSATSAAPPGSFYVKVHNNMPRAVYLVRCIDTRCLGFEMSIRLSRKATAPVFVTTGSTNVYVVERDDNHRYGCLILSGEQPAAKKVRPLAPLARCPH
jgi:hypothetical protein